MTDEYTCLSFRMDGPDQRPFLRDLLLNHAPPHRTILPDGEVWEWLNKKPEKEGQVTTPNEEDAWAQIDAISRKYTKEWLPRKDLRVRALGTERCVELGLGEMNDKFQMGQDMMDFHITQRNVGTMRELAATLIEACDFVEQANPKWATGLSGPPR